jgi:hypothetical protein
VPAATYNIDYASGPASGWFTLTALLGCIVIIAGIVLWYRATRKTYFRRIRIFGGVLVVLIGIAAVVVTIAVFFGLSNDADQARQNNVQDAWGLNENDAAYLLDHAHMDGQGYWSGEELPPTLGRITIDGTVQDGYLLRQGDGLLLIVNDEPVPVIS